MRHRSSSAGWGRTRRNWGPNSRGAAFGEVSGSGRWEAQRCRGEHHHRVFAGELSGAGAFDSEDPAAALEVRFLDRFFDLHVMDAMQVAVSSKLGQVPMAPEDGLKLAAERLERAYAWLNTALAGKTWAAGEDYTLADCAASPSLFYADWVYQIPEHYSALRDYRARLLARPSFVRAVDEARYFRPYFPLGAPDRD